MKILSYEERPDGYMIYTTEADGEFVYPADKFKNLKDLEKEIKKKINEIESKKAKKENKNKQLLFDLKFEDIKENKK